MDRRRLRTILTDLGIEHRDSRRAINICCPFCRGQTRGLPDDRFRLGIFPGTLRYYCFRCHRVGGLFEVLKAAAGITEAEFRRLVGGRVGEEGGSLAARIRAKLFGENGEEAKDQEPPPVFMPEGLSISEAAKRYPEVRRFLRIRQLSIDTCEAYGAIYTGRFGPNAYRLAWPVRRDDGTLAAWQGRDVTGKLKAKYHTEGQVSSVLYWAREYDPAEPLYVVEGVFDCWRMERNAVASFTNRLSVAQTKQLLSLQPAPTAVIIAWDWDSWNKAKGAARQLAPLVQAGVRTGAVRLPEGEDPDSLGAEAVRNLEVWWA